MGLYFVLSSKTTTLSYSLFPDTLEQNN